MKKRKPRSPEKSFQPCPRCGVLTAPQQLNENAGVCYACVRRDEAIFRQYLAQQAIVIVRFDCSHWTPNLFSSTLGIDADGYWIQRVHWVEEHSHTRVHAEQLDCFEPEEWQPMLLEIKDLQTYYQPQLWRMESMEVHAIELKLDGRTYLMEKLADWQCPDGADRFAEIWQRLHGLSKWHDRLKI